MRVSMFSSWAINDSGPIFSLPNHEFGGVGHLLLFFILVEMARWRLE